MTDEQRGEAELGDTDVSLANHCIPPHCHHKVINE